MAAGSRQDFLRTVDVLARTSDDDLAAVDAICVERSCADGELVFAEGTRADAVLVVREGSVLCTRHGAEVTRIGPGEAFGVTSFLDDGPRNVDAVAVGPVSLVVLPREPFLGLARGHPALLRGLESVTNKHLRSVLDLAASLRGSRA